MARISNIGISQQAFDRLAAAIRREWKLDLCAATPDGHIVLGRYPARRPQASDHCAARQLAIKESLRWGDPAFEMGPEQIILFAIPLMHNAELTGGLVASITERRAFRFGTATPAVDLHRAAPAIRRLAEEQNLTNAALLEARRAETTREQVRAEAIHAFKGESGYSMRALYLVDEPALMAAIRRADRGQARAILNELLVRMIHHAQGRTDLVKSFFLELVVTLCRSAVEAGGRAEELLGVNFASMRELAAIHDDVSLSQWLHTMLERIMDTIAESRPKEREEFGVLALRYITEHCAEDLSRDATAEALGISPSHFSRLIKSQLGRPFGELLNQIRIERAAQLLASTRKPLKLVSLETGFKDQSYFTKVFRRYMKVTPHGYRVAQREKTA